MSRVLRDVYGCGGSRVQCYTVSTLLKVSTDSTFHCCIMCTCLNCDSNTRFRLRVRRRVLARVEAPISIASPLCAWRPPRQNSHDADTSLNHAKTHDDIALFMAASQHGKYYSDYKRRAPVILEATGFTMGPVAAKMSPVHTLACNSGAACCAKRHSVWIDMHRPVSTTYVTTHILPNRTTLVVGNLSYTDAVPSAYQRRTSNIPAYNHFP